MWKRIGRGDVLRGSGYGEMADEEVSMNPYNYDLTNSVFWC